MSKAPFGSKVFLKYFKNTSVSKITVVCDTLMRLASAKNCGIDTEVSLKLWYYRSI